MEWIRFWITAVFMVLALIGFASAVFGVYRFGFLMNRMHAAGIGDTLGIFAMALSVIVSASDLFVMLKIALVVALLWMSSPVSTHFLGQVEFYSNKKVGRYVKRLTEEDEEESKGGDE